MLVTSIRHGKAVLNSLRSVPWLCQDTETVARKGWENDKKSTLIYERHRIKIFSICHKGVSYSFPTNLCGPFPTISEWAALFNDYFENINPKCVSVFHNGNYDIRIFSQMGWEPGFQKRIWDTMISSWLANGNEDKALKARAPIYGRYLRDTKTIDFSNLNELAEYAEGDVIVTDEIYQQHIHGKVVRPRKLVFVNAKGLPVVIPNKIGEYVISPEGETLSNFDRTFLRYQEIPVLRSIIRAENRGVPFSKDKLVEVRQPMNKDLERLTKTIIRLAGRPFKITSTAQKVSVLQDLGLTIPKTTKAGKPSVDADSMIQMKGEHPIIDSFMEYSKVEKLRSVYLGKDGLEKYINPRTNRLHTNLATVGAVTGRFSSSCPNLQQIPARNDRYGIRECFIAPEGYDFLCLDFSQIELRVMAMMSQDPLMTKVLNDEDGDLHQTTADSLEVPRDPVAKQCNFLLIFGGGAYALNTRLRMEGHDTNEDECQTWIDSFNGTYYRVPEFREECFDFHRRKGYIPLLTGRNRIIENIDSSSKWKRHKAETQLANNIIQGSAQDLMKNVIVRCDHRLPNMDKLIPSLPSSAFASVHGMCVPTKSHRALLAKYAARVEKFRRLFKEAQLQLVLQVHDELLFTVKKKYAVEVGKCVAEIMSYKPYWQPVYSMGVAIRGDGGVGPSWKAAKKPKDPANKIESPLVIW